MDGPVLDDRNGRTVPDSGYVKVEMTMQQLIDGYGSFHSKIFPQHAKLFEKLAYTQHPGTLFICCSDSRVMPEMMMQCDPGALCSCRNAGNLIPPPTKTGSGVPATVEFAAPRSEGPGHCGLRSPRL